MRVGTNQHHISQSHLRHWSTRRRKSYYIHVLLKKLRRTYVANIEGEACGVGYFDYPASLEPNVTADEHFSALENRGNSVLAEIRIRRNLAFLSEADRKALAEWVAALNVASLAEKQAYLAVHPDLVRMKRARGQDTHGIDESYEHALASFVASVTIYPQFVCGDVLGRRWVLRESEGNYVISDSPVARIDLAEHRESSLSLRTPSVEALFPVSPDLMLQICAVDRHQLRGSEALHVPDGDVPVVRDTRNETHWINVLQLNAAESKVFADSKKPLVWLDHFVERYPGLMESPRYRRKASQAFGNLN